MRNATLTRFDGGSDTILCKLVSEFTPTVLNSEDTITKKKKDRKTKEYYNQELFRYFMTFDIESTTITPDEYIKYEKKRQEAKKNIPIPAHVERPYAFMYHWQCKVANEVVYGHYWDEVFDFFESIQDQLALNKNRRLICYIHNLGFESWWMLPHLKERYGDIELFATAPKKPLYIFVPGLGIEFRCSMRLSNMTLQKAIENEKGCIHPKADGDLDYRKVHLPSQELDDKEFGYTIADVVGLYEYVENRLKNENDTLFSIPLTSTGYVRRIVRKRCLKNKDYRKIFLNTRIDADVLMMLYDAARGGNTHANPSMANRILHDLDSFDAVSEYPYIDVTKQFPMSQFQYYGDVKSMAELNYLLNTYACLFDCVFVNLRLKKNQPVAYVSFDKQKGITGEFRFDNGRVLSCGDNNAPGAIALTLTDVDFKLMRDIYEWDQIAIGSMHIAEYGYLPDEIRDCIMDLFREKCELKSEISKLEDEIEDKKNKNQKTEKVVLDELENLKYLYNKKKNLLNGIFGMMYTRPIHPDIYLDDDLEYKERDLSIGDIKEKLEEYYSSFNSFLSYAWGVWTTAHARAHLQRLICATNDEKSGNVFVYCDTDSSKCIIKNYRVINDLNALIIDECEKVGAYCDVDNKRYYLGVFEMETDEKHGKYAEFKTLGAKKYVYRDKSGIHTTIAGVDKKKAPEELKTIENFEPGFTFYDAGGLTLFYNNVKPYEKTVDGEKLTITNNIAMIDSTYTVHLTMDYSQLLVSYQIEEEFDV